jgi:hypothetical protein
MRLDLAQIRMEVARLAATIEAPDSLLPTYGKTEDSARPHIEVDSAGYHYVVVERGVEVEQITTPELDELLYAVFQTVTFSLACRFAGSHRIAGEDSRRPMFQHQVELLGKLEPRWARRRLQEQDVVLQRHPFTASDSPES